MRIVERGVVKRVLGHHRVTGAPVGGARAGRVEPPLAARAVVVAAAVRVAPESVLAVVAVVVALVEGVHEEWCGGEEEEQGEREFIELGASHLRGAGK